MFAKFEIIPKGNWAGTTRTGKDNENTNHPKSRPESFVLDSSSWVLKRASTGKLKLSLSQLDKKVHQYSEKQSSIDVDSLNTRIYYSKG